jgi:hypothetical protein
VHAQQDHAHNVSSQLQFCCVRLVDPSQEALQRKAGWYNVLRLGEEVPLSVEEMCGHSHETIAIKGAWISASNITLWNHYHSTSDPESPNLGPTWPV